MVHFASHNVVTRPTGMLEQVDIELTSVAAPSRGLRHHDTIHVHEPSIARTEPPIVGAVVRHAFMEGQKDGVALTDPPRVERPSDPGPSDGPPVP